MRSLTLAGLAKKILAGIFNRQPRHSKHESFRLPGPGIINYLLDSYGVLRYNCWVIAKHPSFFKMVENADVFHCPTDAWLDRFSPGIHEHQLSMKQILFLENIRIL